MGLPNHFSSPMLSNWQSAVAKVATSPANNANPFLNALERRPLDFKNEFVAAAASAAHAFEVGSQGGTPPEPTNWVEKAARAALNLGMSRFLHDDDGIKAAQAELAKYGELDPKWAECVAEFIAHYSLTKHGDVPYRQWKSLDDFVLPAAKLPSRCRIGILGDWGTGDVRAQKALEQLGTHDIDVFVHIGDIYYSCTTSEANTFYDNVTKVFGKRNDLQILTLCGNHDVYSGGAPYYGLLNHIGQPASFFCIRNDDWQILAADTGYNDFNPFTQGGTASWVQDHDDGSTYSEMDWHKHKFETAGTRRNLLLSHHQPFTRNSAIDKTSAINNRLLGQFQPYLNQIDLWIWGHEHNQVIYKPFSGVQRGRCVGASAIPVPAKEDLYRPDPAIVGDVPDIGGTSEQLTVDQNEDLYNLGFAVIELDGRKCKESYFEFNTSSRAERLLFEQDF